MSLEQLSLAARRAVLALLLMGLISLSVATAVGQAATPPDGNAEFRIGVGDVLVVFNYAENSREQCLVRPDGKITLPLAGELDAIGRTPAELRAAIVEALAPFQENAQVSVSVQEIHSYRVYMLGNVAQQQSLESIVPLTLLQALASSGGFNDFANKKVVVLRTVDGEPTRLEIDTKPLLSGRAGGRDIVLLSGDVVVAQ